MRRGDARVGARGMERMEGGSGPCSRASGRASEAVRSDEGVHPAFRSVSGPAPTVLLPRCRRGARRKEPKRVRQRRTLSLRGAGARPHVGQESTLSRKRIRQTLRREG